MKCCCSLDVARARKLSVLPILDVFFHICVWISSTNLFHFLTHSEIDYKGLKERIKECVCSWLEVSSLGL